MKCDQAFRCRIPRCVVFLSKVSCNHETAFVKAVSWSTPKGALCQTERQKVRAATYVRSILRSISGALIEKPFSSNCL